MHTYRRQSNGFLVIFDSGGDYDDQPIRLFEHEIHAMRLVSYLNGGTGDLPQGLEYLLDHEAES